MLTHGDASKARAIMHRRGIAIPDDMWPPDLLPGAEEWLDAFLELTTDRQMGMGLGPIPSAAIDRWPVEDAERASFRACIRAMDREYLAHGRDDQPAKADAKTVAAMLRKDE